MRTSAKMRTLVKRLLPGMAMFWLLLGQVGSAQADPVAYVVAHNYSASAPDIFGQVDLTTGAFTQISDLNTPGYTIFGMGFGTNGQIYGVGYSFTSSNGEFYSINPTTGVATDLGPLAFSPFGAASNASGTLYALDTSNSLDSINPPSNSSTVIGSVPFSADGLVAIDAKGNLFAAGNGNGSFYEVNTTNASSTLVGNTGLDGTLFAGSFVGNTLYGFNANGTTTATAIVTINTSNASITTGADVNLPTNYVVVASAYAVPEPTSLVLGLIGGLSALACGLRRRQSKDRDQRV
jgi:hypothetical protein